MNKWICSLVCTTVVFAYPPGSSAKNQELEFANLVSFELDSLLDVRYITVASKLVESSHDAGGAVTQYSADDIEKLGYYRLSDLANITTGYHSHSRSGQTGLGTRGFRGNEFHNAKHLLLVDDIPFHNLRSWKVPVEYSFPLTFAEEVQFLRGPGSALYGANAFYGAIEVEPRSPGPLKRGLHVDAELRYGEPFSQKHLSTNLLNNGATGDSTFSSSFFDRDASAYDASGIDPITENALLWDQQDSKFIFFKHKFEKGLLDGTSFGLNFSEEKSGSGEIDTVNVDSSPDNNTNFKSFVPYLKHERDWTDKLSTRTHVRFNSSKETGRSKISSSTLVDTADYQISLRGFGGNFELGYNVSDKTNILFGVDYDRRRTREFPSSYFYENRTNEDGRVRLDFIPGLTLPIELFGLYGQIHHEGQFLEGNILSLGGRFTRSTHPETDYTNFSPKLSFVQRLRKDLNIRFLYGKSFRTPSYNEIDRNLERANRKNLPVHDLGPELLESVEASIVYHKPDFVFETSVYSQEVSDAIQRSVLPGVVFDNSEDTLESRGIEVSVNYRRQKAESETGLYLY